MPRRLWRSASSFATLAAELPRRLVHELAGDEIVRDLRVAVNEAATLRFALLFGHPNLATGFDEILQRHRTAH